MYSDFIKANGPNEFNKRILKSLCKAYDTMFWENKYSDVCVIIYHDAYNRPVAWCNPEMRGGYFPK